MLACYIPKKKRRAPVETFADGRQVCDLGTAGGRRIYRLRRYQMEVRQGFTCAICTRIAGSAMSFDHQSGRGHGGGHRDDRIVDEQGNWLNAALCFTCNQLKASKRYHWKNGQYVPKENLHGAV